MQVKVRVIDERHRIRIPLMLSIFPVRGLLKAAEPLVCLMTVGSWAKKVRLFFDIVDSTLYTITHSPPEEFVDVELSDEKREVYIKVRTL